MELRLLGGVSLHVHGHEVNLGPRKQRTVLAALLLAEGRPITTDRLAYAVWGERAPADHRALLATYVSRLRRILSHRACDVRIDRRGGGYLLTVDPGAVDVLRFQAAVAEARRIAADGADDSAAEVFHAALSFWRGEPLAGLTGDWVAAQAADLYRQHRDANADHIDTMLRLGHGETALGVLHRLTVAHPLDEQLAAQLMLALHQAGRTAEALSVYESMRRRLADELGVDPSPQLQQAHLRLLRTGSGRAVVRAEVPVPAQLPADVPGFAGRVEDLNSLDEILDPGSETATVVISAIAGTAGVGKTALAVHWAHRNRDQFPDGQLYVNLRGFDPHGSVMEPTEAMRRFLEALGIPPERIPADLDAQAALYRSHLADRRMIIVLDNARDSGHVRPLLPGAAGSLALVTSRNRLTGLVAGGARPFTLDLLSAQEARDLLANRLGIDRITAEELAVEEIIAACTRLPLALAIAAAHAATRPNLTLTALAAELHDTRKRLDLLTGDDPTSDPRAVFSWSYQTLTPPAARMFRLLGLHPGENVSIAGAASLAGWSVEATQPLLAELLRAHLIAEPMPGRYSSHDLLRGYAAEMAHATESQADQQASRQRLVDYYVHTGHTAARLLRPHRDPIRRTPVQPGTSTEQLGDDAAAVAWFAVEHTALLAAVEYAEQEGLDAQASQLAWALSDNLDRRGLWAEQASTHHTALRCAQKLGDRDRQARAHRTIGQAYCRLGRHDAARQHLSAATDIFADLGDLAGQAHTCISLAWLDGRQGQPEALLKHVTLALALFRAAGHRSGQAGALNDIAWFHAQHGDPRQGQPHAEQALALYREIDNPHGEAQTLDTLGLIHQKLGDHHNAITCYAEAAARCREAGDRYHEAETLTHLGDSHLAAGDTDAAERAWRQAVDIFTELDQPDAARVQAKLHQLTAREVTARR